MYQAAVAVHGDVHQTRGGGGLLRYWVH